MAVGVLYIMSTVVPGLIKIGKTTTDNFDNRMYNLEHNGYSNVTGLQRRFAIEVENYDEKERMLDEIFAKSRVPGSELFALNLDLAVELLSSFDGRQIFPQVDQESKQQVFDTAVKRRKRFDNIQRIPDGVYFLKNNALSVFAKATVKDGVFTISAGQHVVLAAKPSIPDIVIAMRRDNIDASGVIINDVQFTSPSTAGSFILGRSCNGWTSWKTQNGQFIDIFRDHSEQNKGGNA